MYIKLNGVSQLVSTIINESCNKPSSLTNNESLSKNVNAFSLVTLYFTSSQKSF